MASGRQLISSLRWPYTKDVRFTLLPGQEKRKIRSLPGRLAPFGPVDLTKSHPNRWMRRLFLLRWEPLLPYNLFCEKRNINSVANQTRADGRAFLELVPNVPVRTETETFPMSHANEALERLRTGQIQGAAVLVPDW